MTSALEGGEGSASRPGSALPPGKSRYPFYRRLSEPQGRCGQVRKISPPPGFEQLVIHHPKKRRRGLNSTENGSVQLGHIFEQFTDHESYKAAIFWEVVPLNLPAVTTLIFSSVSLLIKFFSILT